MASAVATPLERQFGRIAGVTEMTSSSGLGSTQHDAAVRAWSQTWTPRRATCRRRSTPRAASCRRTCRAIPNYRKVNPADAPIAHPGAHVRHGAARARSTTSRRSMLAQKLAQVRGRRPGQRRRRRAAGGARRAEPDRAEQVRHRARAGAHRARRRPTRTGRRASSPTRARAGRSDTDDQLFQAEQLHAAHRRGRNGAIVRLADVARGRRTRSRTSASAGCANGKPGVLVIVMPEPGANIIDTVDRVRARAAAASARSLPRGVDMKVAVDRTHDDSRLGARRRAHARDRDRARDPGRVRVPAQRLGDLHPGRRGAAVAARHVRRDVVPRLQPRQPVADGAHDLHGLRRRRRDRRAREHHAPPRRRHGRRSRRRCGARARSASRCSR